MSTTHTNGNGGAPTGGLREKVTFETNLPQTLILEFDPPSEPREGRFGPQFMYFMGGGRILWADPPLHAAIVKSGAGAGEEIAVCKRESRPWPGAKKHTAWEVETAATAARRAPEAIAATAAPTPQPAAATPPAATPAAPHAAPTPAKRAPATPAVEISGRISGNLMTAALQQALEACEQSGFSDARPDDVRALAITIYITATGGRQK